MIWILLKNKRICFLPWRNFRGFPYVHPAPPAFFQKALKIGEWRKKEKSQILVRERGILTHYLKSKADCWDNTEHRGPGRNPIKWERGEGRGTSREVWEATQDSVIQSRFTPHKMQPENKYFKGGGLDSQATPLWHITCSSLKRYTLVLHLPHDSGKWARSFPSKASAPLFCRNNISPCMHGQCKRLKGIWDRA